MNPGDKLLVTVCVVLAAAIFGCILAIDIASVVR